jgi:hypothetical protein
MPTGLSLALCSFLCGLFGFRQLVFLHVAPHLSARQSMVMSNKLELRGIRPPTGVDRLAKCELKRIVDPLPLSRNSEPGWHVYHSPASSGPTKTWF